MTGRQSYSLLVFLEVLLICSVYSQKFPNLRNLHPAPHFGSPCTLVASHPLGLFAFRKEGGRLRDPGDPGCIESLRSSRWGQGTVPEVLACCVLPLAS